MSWCEHDSIRSRCKLCSPRTGPGQGDPADQWIDPASLRQREQHRAEAEVRASIVEDLSRRLPLVRRLLTHPPLHPSTVFLTGRHPHEPDDLVELFPAECETVVAQQGDPLPLLADVHVVVIGERDWHRDALTELIRYRPEARFLPQPVILDMVLFGNEWWISRTDELEAMASAHEGLRFVLEERGCLGPVPSPETANGTGTLSSRLAPTSFLAEMGYSVARGGPSEASRRETLKSAASERGCLAVVEHLEGILDLNSRKKDPPRRAIEKWKADLIWLRHHCRENGT